jgi:hypothetical protein
LARAREQAAVGALAVSSLVTLFWVVVLVLIVRGAR